MSTPETSRHPHLVLVFSAPQKPEPSKEESTLGMLQDLCARLERRNRKQAVRASLRVITGDAA